MRRLFVLLLLITACGGEPAAETTTTVEAPTTTTTEAAVPEATVAVATTPPSAVLGILSGRGDDGSFEVVVWLDAPIGAADRIVVGIDSDDSYPGSGDPTGDFEGWVDFGAQVSVGSDGALVAGGTSDAGGASAAIGDWVSWGADGAVLRVFFIRDPAPFSGSIWVLVGDTPGPAGIAGVVTGEGCSIRGSGLPFEAGGDVPDSGITCRYAA